MFTEKEGAVVTVIVPVYNREDTIARCLESLLHQTYKNLVVLVIDDASTDNTRDILNSYRADSRVQVVCNQTNMGEGYTRNVGLSLANTKYITFVDSDDYVERDFIYNMLSKMKADTELVVTGYVEVDGVRAKKRVRVQKESENPYLNFLKGGLNGGLWNKLFLLEVITKNNIRFNERIYQGTDTVFIGQYASLIDNVEYSETFDYNYILNGNSITKNIKKETFMFLSYIDEIEKYKKIGYFDVYKTLFAHNIMIKMIAHNSYYGDIGKQVQSAVRGSILKWLKSNELNIRFKVLLLIACINKTLYRKIIEGINGR